MDSIQKMIPLKDGKRTAVKLDTATWQAIEWLAGQQFQSWQQWCADVIERTPKDENSTAAVRAAAVDGLLAKAVFPDRAEQLAAMEANPLVSNNAAFNDKQFQGFMNAATVQGESDFGGFKVLFGFDKTGADFLAVHNGLRDGLHFVTMPRACMMNLDGEDGDALEKIAKLGGIASSHIAGKQYQAHLHENSVVLTWLEQQPEENRHDLMAQLLANYGEGGFIAGIKQIDPTFKEPSITP